MTQQDQPNPEDNQSPDEGGRGFKLKRAPLTTMNCYEISEYELVAFEQGGNSSLALTFSTFLLSFASSFLIVLLTVDLAEKYQLYISFFSLTVIGFVLGFLLLIAGLRGRTSVRKLGQMVRARMT